jgi:hypothetical protein
MNVIIKITCCHSAFRVSCENFYSTKVKKGKEAKVPAMYNMVRQLSPINDPWHKVVQL